MAAKKSTGKGKPKVKPPARRKKKTLECQSRGFGCQDRPDLYRSIPVTTKKK